MNKIRTEPKKFYRWYVYRLVDPRTNKPFYIGKGNGNRIDAHEQNALDGVCHPKCLVIKDIWSQNLQIIKEKVAYFWDEQGAYDYEYTLIQEIGIDNLTNLVNYTQSVRFNAERPKPFTPSLAMGYIKRLSWMFALWLKDQNNAPRVDERYHPMWKLIYHTFFDMFWKHLAKTVFDTASKNEANRTEMVKLFKPYGVELSYEEAPNGC